MSDLLNGEYINGLPQPFIAHMHNGSSWPVYDMEVQTGLLRIDVCGKLDLLDIADVNFFRDEIGTDHSAETFYLEQAEPTP